MKTTAPAFVLILGISVAGCLPDTSGNNPPPDRFIYPVGLAMTANDDYVLVANSNFDLEYNSGTLVAVDLKKMDSVEGIVSDDGDYLFLPVEDGNLIDSSQTIRLGAFASDLEMTPSRDMAIIPVRGERAILLVDVDESETGKVLSCGEDEDRRCDSAHRVESNERFTLPIEPYEVASLDYTEPNGNITTLGFATHLAGGEVSLFVIRDGKEGSKASAELVGVVKGVVPGASGIAVNPVNLDVYVSGRRDPNPHVAIMRVLTDSETGYYSKNPFFNQVGHVDLGAEMFAGTDARGIAVAETGERAYLITRTPEALVELDVENYEMKDMTILGAEPSIDPGADPSVVAMLEDDNATPDPIDDATYAFVLCFNTNQVFVIDVNMMKVTAVRATGAGPHAIAFDKTRKRAYIANFRESTITMLQAEEPFDYVRDGKGRVIKIGEPRLPKGHD